MGTLYVVATPIGNLQDLSPRAVETLKQADRIIAEDTRVTMKLCQVFGLHARLVSCHRHNEDNKAPGLAEEILEQNLTAALVTDAGTPCISDPGNELIRAAVEADIPVVGIPGACAAVTALSISGFDLSTFLFYGFFPREAADRRRLLEKMREGQTRTYVFYESPKRIMDAVEFFIGENAGLRLCVCNDLTKLHEMTFRGTPAEVRDQLLAKGNYDKGEFCIVAELDEDYIFVKREHVVSPEALLVDKMIQESCRARDAIRLVLADENNSYSKNELYAASLRLKELFG